MLPDSGYTYQPVIPCFDRGFVMKLRILIIALIVLFFGGADAVLSQAEGGGGSASSKVDYTFKRKWRPPAKHTAPKRIAAKKTAADYEAEGDRFYDQKD